MIILIPSMIVCTLNINISISTIPQCWMSRLRSMRWRQLMSLIIVRIMCMYWGRRIICPIRGGRKGWSNNRLLMIISGEIRFRPEVRMALIWQKKKIISLGTNTNSSQSSAPRSIIIIINRQIHYKRNQQKSWINFKKYSREQLRRAVL